MPFSKEKLTKYTGNYRCPDEIRNFKIRVKFKDVDANEPDLGEEGWHTQEFRWQEKCFSKIERDFYGDIHNCVTDLEKNYHEKIQGEENLEGRVLFTYVHEDGYRSEQEIFRSRTYLQTVAENADDSTDVYPENLKEFDYDKSLQQSIENSVPQTQFEKMYIMADLGEYVENIWIKNEHLVTILKFNKATKLLLIYPDFTTTQPYCINIQGGTIRIFYYFIENCSEEIPGFIALKEREILKQITDCKAAILKEATGDCFNLPPRNKLHVYLFLEILSAKNFEYSDVCVQYSVDLPEDWSCEDLESLKGATQTCHGVNEEGLVHFGHCFDIMLEYDIENLQKNHIPKTPYIYFEIFSKGTWNRYRTEGLAYKDLPISTPGYHFYNLSCFRFNTPGPYGNLRRFFIGDCGNYSDVTWIGVPKGIEGTVFNKYGVHTVGTGQLNVRVNVVHHSQAFLDKFLEGDHREKLIYDKLNCSSLIKSVDEVVRAFKRARRNMIDVRENL